MLSPSGGWKSGLGGTETRLLKIIEEWTSKGVNVALIGNTPPPLSDYCRGARTYRIHAPSGAKRVLFPLSLLRYCTAVIKECRPHVIECFDASLLNYVMTYIAARITRRQAVIVIQYINEDVVLPSYGLFARKFHSKGILSFTRWLAKEFLRRLILGNSDILLAVSRTARAHYAVRYRIPYSKFVVTGNGVSGVWEQSSPDKLYDAVSVGRLSKNKGIPDLIEVWKKVKSNGITAKLAVVGGSLDEAQNLRQTVRKAGLEDCVDILGQLPLS